MNYDYTTLAEKLSRAPENIQEALTSPQFAEVIKGIGKQYELKIDQESILFDCVTYILLGLMPAKDFAKIFSKESGVGEQITNKIILDLNKQVFSSFRNLLTENADPETDTQTASTISNIEQVGGFQIEKPAPVSINKITPADRETALKHLENPPIPKDYSHETHTEPLVDHLLQNSVSAGIHKQHVEPQVPDNLPIVGEVPQASPKPAADPFKQTPISIPVPPKAPEAAKPAPRTGPDPYREIPK